MLSKMNCQHVNGQNIYKIVKILEYLCPSQVKILSGAKNLSRDTENKKPRISETLKYYYNFTADWQIFWRIRERW